MNNEHAAKYETEYPAEKVAERRELRKQITEIALTSSSGEEAERRLANLGFDDKDDYTITGSVIDGTYEAIIQVSDKDGKIITSKLRS